MREAVITASGEYRNNEGLECSVKRMGWKMLQAITLYWELKEEGNEVDLFIAFENSCKPVIEKRKAIK